MPTALKTPLQLPKTQALLPQALLLARALLLPPALTPSSPGTSAFPQMARPGESSGAQPPASRACRAAGNPLICADTVTLPDFAPKS